MGFYGNITNTSRTQFQFDRTFPNRTVMDQFIGTDGVYIGRFVLVEYDKALAADWCITAYMKTDANNIRRFYTGKDISASSEIGYGNDNIAPGKYIRVPGSFRDTDGTWISYNLDNESITEDYLYLINPKTGDDNIPLDTVLVSYKSAAENDYIVNYELDRKTYGGGRGYDSTVWQKVYTNGAEKYVMIAELNTVVPTFDIAPDPPTMNPIAPHFDIASTDVYYKLHQQAPWGFRVGQASNASVSDGTTTWKTVEYNPETGLVENKETKTVNAAIYFNKAGFRYTL